MVKKPDFTVLFAKYCLHTNKLPPKGLSLDELPNLYQRRTKYKSEDEFLTNNLSDILCGYTTGVLVSRSRVEAWLEVKKQTIWQHS